MKRIRIIQLLTFLCISMYYGQSVFNPSFEHLSYDNGFPAKDVSKLVKGADGMLWMKTEKGLMRYNGYSGKFYSPKKDSSGLLHSEINSIYIDKKGLIWIGYIGTHISSFDPKTEVFTHYYNKPNAADGFPNVMATVKFIEENNNLWILTWGGGIVKMNREKGTFKQFFPDEHNPNAIHGTRVKDMISFGNGTFIVGTFMDDDGKYDNFIEIFDSKNETFRKFPIAEYTAGLSKVQIDKLLYALKIVNCIYVDPDKNLWVGTYIGLIFIDTKHKTAQFISPNFKNKNNESVNKSFDNTRSYVFDDNGRLWFATASTGILVVDIKTKECFFINHNVENEGTLSDSRIKGFYRDNEHNIWVTSLGGGIDIYSPLLQHFQIISEQKLGFEKNNKGESNNGMNKFEINEKDNQIYIPSLLGLIIYDLNSDQVSKVDVGSHFIKKYNQKELIEYRIIPSAVTELAQRNNNLFIINHGEPIIYDMKTKKSSFVKFEKYNGIYGIKCGKFTRDLFAFGAMLPPGKEWNLENFIYKIYKYDTLKNEFVDDYIFPKLKLFSKYGLSSNVIDQINRTTWFIQLNDMLFYIYDTQLKTVKPFSVLPELHNFPDSMLRVLTIDSQEKIWLAGKNGVYQFDHKTGKTINYNKTFDLGKEEVYNIVEDKQGNIWISLEKEIIKYSLKTGAKIRFNKNFGLKPGCFIKGYISHHHLSNLYFPTFYGLLYFNPEKINLGNKQPKITLTQLVINNDTLSESQKLFFETGSQKLSWNQNFIRFEFATDQIYTLRKKRFYYRMIGIDTTWINNGTSNKISYTNLSSGNYTLQVKAENPYYDTTSIISIPFSISKAFWWQWWFIVIELALCILLIRFYIKNREEKLQQAKIKLEKTIAERTVEITEKAEEIKVQNNVIQLKNKELTDSIQYAKRIQYALLAHEEFMKEYLADYFVLFKPKDIVSGDFYWATKKDNLFFVAICDSTGHGVPGAFMSLLNISFLNEAISEKNILQPHLVLNYVRKKLIDYLSFDGGQDGMDGTVICYDKESNKITYASAYNKPILIRNNSITELNADKMPIGKGISDKSFNGHHIDLNKGDILYLFTDGFADQFGGEKGKKYKHKQLEKLLLEIHQLPLDNQKQRLNSEFENWKGELEQVDDVLLFGIRV